jgi:hypothetical protein
MPGPGRDPYGWVKTALRQEVGSCCPVQDCGSPYLTWHHFDPPWRVEHHHRPAGMIALCREHADKADHGAFTDDQLRELKRVGRSRALEIRGRFDWMRRDLLTVVDGKFFYQTPIIFQISDIPCIWFDRDENGYLLLNFKMPTISGHPHAQVDQNFWSITPDVSEVVCPPNGRLIEVNYSNGDKFRIEFRDIASPEELSERYPEAGTRPWSGRIEFPIVLVEVSETVAGTEIDFGPTYSNLLGFRWANGFVAFGRVGVQMNVSKERLAALFP